MLVADFSRVLAGPLATMMLADFGATVIKIERPGTGDDTRAWGPPWTAHASLHFECVNHTKRSIVLDLANPADLAAARELARRADVVVENFRTGVLDRYGLGYDDVRAINPEIIYCSITGFGDGAKANLPRLRLRCAGVGRVDDHWGRQGDPTKVGVALVDVLTGKDAVIGILAALRHRDRTGEGQRIKVDLLSSCLGALVNQAAAFLATGEAPKRMGNRHPSIVPYETLRCADGYLAVAVGNDSQFRALTRALGRGQLADDPRLARIRHGWPT